MASIVDYLKSQGQDSSYANRATLASQKGIQGYQGTAAQNTQLLGLLSQPAPTTVSTSALQPGSKIAIPQNNVSQMPQLPVVSPQETAVNNAMTQNSQVEQGYTQANSDLQTLSKQLENKGTDTLALEQQQGIPQISQKVLELQDLANQKALEANLTPYSLQGQGRGITTGILRGQEAVKQRQLQVEGIFANAQLQAAQGKLQLAQSQVDRAINLKYEPILAKIDAQKQILENNKYLLSRADQKLATAKSALLDQQKIEQEQKMAEEKDMKSLALKVGANGAPPKIIDSIANAKTFNEAIIAATPFLQSASDKADLSYKIAQTAKIYADMKNDAMTVGSNVAPENMLPFSQEYAATGKIPVGAPKGSQASIMRYAKELPQAKGSMVSSITGVKNTSLGVDAQSDIARLYNITEAVKELKKLDEKRIGGLLGGTLGKVFGSDAQSAYLTKRKSIIDDLSRMQSGAALTESEVSFYEDYLPGRLSETAFLGQDSTKKIEKFEQAMNSKLQNSLKNNQLSVYGYSKVDLGGTEYTVGDLIQANGVTGRVNPDGTITIVQ